MAISSSGAQFCRNSAVRTEKTVRAMIVVKPLIPAAEKPVQKNLFAPFVFACHADSREIVPLAVLNPRDCRKISSADQRRSSSSPFCRRLRVISYCAGLQDLLEQNNPRFTTSFSFQMCERFSNSCRFVAISGLIRRR